MTNHPIGPSAAPQINPASVRPFIQPISAPTATDTTVMPISHDHNTGSSNTDMHESSMLRTASISFLSRRAKAESVQASAIADSAVSAFQRGFDTTQGFIATGEKYRVIDRWRHLGAGNRHAQRLRHFAHAFAN